jgi:hypothetical protein
MANCKRSEVTAGEKLRYISMAIQILERSKSNNWRTDIIGIACQFSVAPKLKREDFESVLVLPLGEIVERYNRERVKMPTRSQLKRII